MITDPFIVLENYLDGLLGTAIVVIGLYIIIKLLITLRIIGDLREIKNNSQKTSNELQKIAEIMQTGNTNLNLQKNQEQIVPKKEFSILEEYNQLNNEKKEEVKKIIEKLRQEEIDKTIERKH